MPRAERAEHHHLDGGRVGSGTGNAGDTGAARRVLDETDSVASVHTAADEEWRWITPMSRSCSPRASARRRSRRRSRSCATSATRAGRRTSPAGSGGSPRCSGPTRPAEQRRSSAPRSCSSGRRCSSLPRARAGHSPFGGGGGLTGQGFEPVMDFDLTPEQNDLRAAVRAFARRSSRPPPRRRTSGGEFPTEIVKRAAERAVRHPIRRGARRPGRPALVLPVPRGDRYDSSLAITLEAAVGLAASRYSGSGPTGSGSGGSSRWRGEGSRRVRAHRTRAARTPARSERRRIDGDEWVIDGSKAFITNSGTPLTSVILVAARDEDADDGDVSVIVVPVGTRGSRSGRATGSWAGARATPTVSFDGCGGPSPRRTRTRVRAVPRDARRRPRRDRRALGGARAPDAWRRAFGTRASARRSGDPIGAFEALQFKMADMQVGVETARLAYQRARVAPRPRAPVRHRGVDRQALRERGRGVERGEAVQIHGGYGFVEDFPVARFYRDAKVLEIEEGTSRSSAC